MKSTEFFNLIEPIAPIAYSKEFCSRYGAYDNSGLLIDCGNEVRAAAFALDLSVATVEKAAKIGAGAIVTHHPAIYSKFSSLSVSDETSGAVLAAARAGISVISMHLNLDAAEDGIDECLARAVRQAASEASGETACAAACEAGCETGCAARCAAAEEKMLTFACGSGGYGRVYDLAGGKEVSAAAFKQSLDRVISGKHTLLYASAYKKVKRAASFCGAGADEEAVAFAVKNGADALISSDFKHHILKEAVSRGMAVIAPTHYASESYGFEKFYLKVKKIVGTAGVVCEYFENSALL